MHNALHNWSNLTLLDSSPSLPRASLTYSCRKYATQMLKQGFIRHTVNKSSFSEQCYYVMSPLILELCGSLSALNIEDNLDSVSERAAVSTAAENGVVSQAQCRQIKNTAGMTIVRLRPERSRHFILSLLNTKALLDKIILMLFLHGNSRRYTDVLSRDNLLPRASLHDGRRHGLRAASHELHAYALHDREL